MVLQMAADREDPIFACPAWVHSTPLAPLLSLALRTSTSAAFPLQRCTLKSTSHTPALHPTTQEPEALAGRQQHLDLRRPSSDLFRLPRPPTRYRNKDPADSPAYSQSSVYAVVSRTRRSALLVPLGVALHPLIIPGRRGKAAVVAAVGSYRALLCSAQRRRHPATLAREDRQPLCLITWTIRS